MKTPLKIISLLLASLLIVLVTSILVLPTLINTNTFKQTLTQQVESITGQRLIIQGDLSLSVFPWLGIKTDKVTLSQSTDLSPENLLEIDGVNISVKLLPILKRKIEINTIELDRPRVYYVINPSGKTSLDSFNPVSAKANSNKTTRPNNSNNQTQDHSNPSHQQLFSSFFIAGLKIKAGQLIYDDQQTQQRYVLNHVNVTTGNLLTLGSAPIAVEAKLEIDQQEPFFIALTAEAGFNINNKTFAANNISLKLEEPSNNIKLNSTLDSVTLNNQNNTFSLKKFKLRGDIDTLSPELAIANADINFSSNITSPIRFSFSEKQSNSKIDGQFSIKNWQDNIIFKGDIKSQNLNAYDLLSLLDIDYTPKDQTVLKKVEFSTEFSGTENGLSLHNALFELDETILTGDISLINFKEPQYRFDLTLNKITIDRYLPKIENNSEAISNTTQSGLAIVAPIALFRHLTANGFFRAKELNTNGAKLNDIILDVSSKNNTASIKSSASLYGGTSIGTINFQENSNESSLTINNSLTNVQLGELLKDTQINDQISGIANLIIDLNFLDSNNIQTHKGTIRSLLKNGAITGFDIKSILDQTQKNIDQLRGKAVSTNEESIGNADDETGFTEMSATLLLENNTLSNQDLVVKAPAFRIKGKGTISLLNESIDYLTTISAVNTNSGQGGKDQNQLKGISVPVRFYGELQAPNYKVDMAALIKENTKAKVNKRKEELKGELKNKLAEKLGLESVDPETKTETETATQTNQSTDEKLKNDLKNKILDKLF